MEVFHKVSQGCSRMTTEQYSTSFSSAIRLLHKEIRRPIYNIYGFVRFADEIVDSFQGHDKSVLLQEFKHETYLAIERKLSLNPILNSFQLTVNEYNIDHELIAAFFRSMEMDLNCTRYDESGYEQYIYGSAEVVGLMCLYVFCGGRKAQYEELRPYAQSLGAAFQKVNFLRDIKADFMQLSRVYFPGVDFSNFTHCTKKKIEDEIAADFRSAYIGILKLPMKARFGVYVAYKYYLSLFEKIKSLQPESVLEERIRIPNYRKALIIMRAEMKNQLRLI